MLDLMIRGMSLEDIPSGLCLCRASGWNQVEQDWRVFLTWPGSAGFLAEGGGEVLGSVAMVRHDPLVWIAMMLVYPQHRRHGLATKLMERILDEAASAACIGLDATPAGEPLYRRFGFDSDRQLVRMKASMAYESFEQPAGARRMRQSDLPAVLDRDREVFGADRGRLLAWLLDRSPESAWVAGASGVRGYVFGRPGYLYHQIGPLVADDLATARVLVNACCPGLQGREVVIDASCSDAEWMRSLGSLGFVEQRPFVRMFRQPATHPGLPMQQYAIVGPEFG
jgi:GNAT superfamily N-acetyltransferase